MYAMPSAPHSATRNAIRAALHQLIGDKFEILQWIGGGGMAEVFLARHRTHGALFAVKVLSEQLAGDPKIVARFIEEARTAATLGGHPNIGEIFDIGEGAGLHYLIMPYVEGEDLSSYLERHGRLSNAESLDVIRQVTEALVWAGERHVVHRDLKPSNVRIDRSGRAIVLDFGIAKAGDVPSALTRAGETLGTPYYMSPEQIKGETCDPRSDLYSLGVIFFETLSGLKPFTGDTLRAIELAHVQKLPPALSTVVPAVDPQMEQVVNRLLEKEPAKRYQSARELLEELRALGQGMPPVHLEPRVEKPDIPAETLLESAPPAADQAQAAAPSVRKKKSPLWPIATVAVLVAAVAGGAYWAARHGPEPKTAPQPPMAKTAPAGEDLPKMLNEASGPMFLVPAGKFIFGSDDPESPNKRQELELPAFYVDATEVSNAQYARFVRAASHKPPESETFATQPAFPVAGVTLEDAKAYCEWAGKRVPTEQEWEKAGRGTGGNVYPWGNQPLPNPGKIVAVDEYPDRQSPFQALNMSGNVFEWTVSEFPVTDREIEDMKKLSGGLEVSRNWCNIKGGSFLLKDERFFRLYMRRGWPVNQASPLIGFRCVKDAK
jgi:serine/threonine-protein kinase